jgi:demethylmenaquinone methyltransferase/2-methoxy-6-polyprenyl-1,4-benzoquinol methylase
MTTGEKPTNPPPPWDDRLLANPHAVADKRGRVQRMFAAIAPSYDLNNRLHSLWMDQSWRRRAVKRANLRESNVVVDVACGTGDLALRFARNLAKRKTDGLPVPWRVVGIDFTFDMLPLARAKSRKARVPDPEGVLFYAFLDEYVQWVNGDAQSLPLPDQSADIVSIAFGIRNVADPASAIAEFHRVLRPGGRLIILEFSLPANPILRGLYNFYFRKILPRTATLISGDKTGAYKYLPESVNTFIGREQMMQMMRDAGFVEVEHFSMTFGVCVCYRGVKRDT